MINFPFWTNGKSIILGVPIHEHSTVISLHCSNGDEISLHSVFMVHL